MDYQFIIDRVVPVLNRGLEVTVELIIPGIILGFVGGVVLGTLRVFAPAWLRRLSNFYAYVFRGVPLLVQLFLLYYGLPKLGILMSGLEAAALGFILCTSAYHSEYIRGALITIKQGQIKAAEALGFGKLQMLKSIIIPQALRYALPGCGNEFIYLIKYTSLAYVTTCMDMTNEARNLANNTYKFVEVFSVLGLYYLALTSIAGAALHVVEKYAYIPGFGKRK